MSFENSKKDEIKRLTTPLTFKNSKVYDNTGKIINSVETLYDIRYIIEPKEGILSDDEILQYAPQSKSASHIRLKRGNGDISDLLLIHEMLPQALGLYYIILICIAVHLTYGGNRFVMLFLLILIIIPLIYLYTIFNTKKYLNKTQKDSEVNTVKSSPQSDTDCIESLKVFKNEINNLHILFEVKEEVVRNLIEKRFEPPQITYDKFISVIDSSHKIFNIHYDSAMSIINLAVDDTPRIKEELNKKIQTMKSILNEIETLTNELVININDDESHEEVKNLLDDMENLIESVKEY